MELLKMADEVQTELLKEESVSSSEFSNSFMDVANVNAVCHTLPISETSEKNTLLESAVDQGEKKKNRRRRCRRKSRRRNRPGNGKRRSQKFKNKKRNRIYIQRSRLGAPYLCNDMVMAKNGWVFDTSSGKIEFKPDIVQHQAEHNSTSSEKEGQSSPEQNRYLPISPVGESNSHCQECDCTLHNNFHDNIAHESKEQSARQVETEIKDEDGDSAYESPVTTTSCSYLGREPQDFDDIVSPYYDDNDISFQDDGAKDFQFHMENFEDDTDRYLRESLMDLSRENLEAQYHSTLKKYRDLQNETFTNEEVDLNCVWQDGIDSTTGSVIQQMEGLKLLTSNISCSVQQLQEENHQLKQENFHLRGMLGNAVGL